MTRDAEKLFHTGRKAKAFSSWRDWLRPDLYLWVPFLVANPRCGMVRVLFFVLVDAVLCGCFNAFCQLVSLQPCKVSRLPTRSLRSTRPKVWTPSTSACLRGRTHLRPTIRVPARHWRRPTPEPIPAPIPTFPASTSTTTAAPVVVPVVVAEAAPEAAEVAAAVPIMSIATRKATRTFPVADTVTPEAFDVRRPPTPLSTLKLALKRHQRSLHSLVTVQPRIHPSSRSSSPYNSAHRLVLFFFSSPRHLFVVPSVPSFPFQVTFADEKKLKVGGRRDQSQTANNKKNKKMTRKKNN